MHIFVTSQPAINPQFSYSLTVSESLSQPNQFTEHITAATDWARRRNITVAVVIAELLFLTAQSKQQQANNTN